MQKILAAAAFAAAFGICGAADAADLNGGSMKDAPAYMPANVWTGFYIGVNGGYGTSSNSSTLDTYAYHDWDTTSGTGSATLTTEGGFGGGQIGYNVQHDRLVFGIEADIQGSDIKGSKSSEADNGDGDLITDARVTSNLDWFGTLRGRAGYLFGNTLVYATGGLAFGGVKDTLTGTVTRTWGDGTTVPLSASKDNTLTGYVVGGGIETPLWPAWTLKAEYQYIDLGATTLSSSNSISYGYYDYYTDTGSASVKVNHTYNTIRLGLNYKLNQPYEPLK